jgi:hypothetical protein
LFCDKTTAELVFVGYLLDVRVRTGEAPGRNAALKEVGVDAAGPWVDELRVCLQVGTELLLQLAVLQEESGRRVIHLEERPDLRVLQFHT